MQRNSITSFNYISKHDINSDYSPIFRAQIIPIS
jgi:hypothetical protein